MKKYLIGLYTRNEPKCNKIMSKNGSVKSYVQL